MGLYHNNIQFVWNLEQGEYVAFIRYPFKELYLDPVFRVLAINSNYTANIQVVESSFLSIGTTYLNQPLAGLRRVKLTTITDELRYNTHV